MSNRRRALGAAMVASALIAGSVSMPAFANPTAGSKITAPPDAGVRPVFAGTPILPTGHFALPSATPSTPKAALDQQIAALTNEISVLDSQRWTLLARQSEAKLATALADYAWRSSADELREARKAAEEAAKQAYLTAGELPPQIPTGPLRELDALRPRVNPSRGISDAAARELARVQKAEAAALHTLNDAIAAEQLATEAYNALETLYNQRGAALAELNSRRAAMQTLADRQTQAAEQQLPSNYDAGKSNGGLVANPKAQQAVHFAYAQRGKPYRWGDEGPNTYDCSGLMWAAYRSAGVSLNRVANDQYWGTRSKPVATTALLPGDLLFFATNPADWRSIHHVAMYLGEGKMLHAPSTGDVVRVKAVNYSSIDFATRVVDAIPAPPVTPPTSTPPSNSPSPRPSASISPSPSASASASSSPSASASPAGSPPSRTSPSPVVVSSTSPSPSPNP